LGAEDWPEFRGPTKQGHAGDPGLPLEWGEGKNIAWKTAIPGKGWSSPVIYGDQIWVTTATQEAHSLRAVCVHRDTGKLIYDVEVFQLDDPPLINPKNSYASPTAAIEKGRAYVHFGTFGTACLSTETADILWTNRTLTLDHKEGPGSSLALVGDRLIFHCDGMDVQYIVALDKHTGKIDWKTNRSGKMHENIDFRKAFCMPLVIDVNGRDQVISPGAFHVYAYDLETGKEEWLVRIPGFSNVPRPVYGRGLLYICTGFTQPELWAIRPGGKGDVTETHVAWMVKRQVPANASPILVDDTLYMVSDNGIATCMNPDTGEIHWAERLKGNYSASPIHADGRITFFSEEGKAYTIQPSKSFELLATNELDAGFMASPAVVGQAMYLRTKTHLYRIEKPSEPTSKR
jgi:outer membrane protein assembly factor BamB